MMEKFVKIVKRIVVAFVLCLAVVGAYALLKKAPQLNVSTEDIHYLQEVGISASETASDEGLSGAHGHVLGAPPLASPSGVQGSNTPPGSFGTSITSSPLPSTTSEAPAFAIATEAPPFAGNSEAPPFAGNSEAPPFVTANPEAATAAPFSSPTPMLTFSAPSVPLQSTPLQTTIPVSSAPVLPAPVLPAPVLPVSPPPSPPPDQPVTWDGPITEVIFVPSTDFTDPWRVSGIAEPKSNSLPLPKPVDPFLAVAVSAEPPAKQKTAAPINQPVNSVNPINKENIPIANNRIKRLPVVVEETPVERQTVANPIDFEKETTLFATAIPVDSSKSSKRPYSQTTLIPTGKDYPKDYPFKLNDYQQTSIRTDVVFAPVLPSVNEERPMISFVQQKPEKSAVRETLPALKETISATTVRSGAEPTEIEIPFTRIKSVVADGEVKPIDSIPFVAVENSSVSLTTEIPAKPGVLPVRETVERFVKAQTELIESGEPTKIRNAFIQLSRLLYEYRELNDAERASMLPLLDRLALNVIYSRNAHILEPAYTVRLGDSIDSIAQAFDLSSALLMKINGLTGARPLEPGTVLKVVVGHFDARISAGHRELTLILGGLYAGRFSVALGERIEHLRGEFYVSSKTDTWNEKSLTLNNGVVLYGTDRPQPGDPLATTVRFTQQDAKELFDILTEHSVVIFED
ncbi:MAG: LysM peptidoglycan-binding domain-containing protein [Planctomycetaceae bacterium]|nr:LysM peptidoglycan-binding domain-containing protein [Planctomycetaceae bacterium]